MPNNLEGRNRFFLQRGAKHFAAVSLLYGLLIALALCVWESPFAFGQDAGQSTNTDASTETVEKSATFSDAVDSSVSPIVAPLPSTGTDLQFQPAAVPESEPGTGAERAGEDSRNRGKQPVDSELIMEGEGSFAHYHIFAYTWWSELYSGGIEYDRHTWDYFLKSQMDWVMEVLPVTILVQPAKTDVFGDPLTTAKEVNPGLGIYPIGLRMKWRHDKVYQPYFIIKGGMLIFDKKALSSAATYQNFSLQIGLGMQRRLTKRIDVRVGYEDIHFSNGFMVPNNPGLDVMAYDGGIVYRLGK